MVCPNILNECSRFVFFLSYAASNALKVGPEADDIENSMIVEAEPEMEKYRRRRLDYLRPRRSSSSSQGMRSRTYSLDSKPNLPPYSHHRETVKDLSHSVVSGKKIQDRIQQNEIISKTADVVDHTGNAANHRSRRKRDQNDNTPAMRSLVKDEPFSSEIS